MHAFMVEFREAATRVIPLALAISLNASRKICMLSLSTASSREALRYSEASSGFFRALKRLVS
jgi:hypothetical protein